MSIFDKLSGRVSDILGEVMMPDDVRRAQDRAALALQEEAYNQVLTILRPTLVQHPNIARTHHLIGLAHFHSESFLDARAAFLRAIELRESASSHFYAGLCAEKLLDLRDAVRHFSRALALPENEGLGYDLHFGLGRVYLSMHRPDKAERELRRALRSWPDQVDTRILLGRALFQRGKYKEARETLIHQDLQHRPVARLYIARILEKEHHFVEALRIYKEVVEMDDQPEVEALVGATTVAIALEEADLAMKYLRQIPSHSMETVEMDLLFGRALELAKDLEGAEARFRAVLAQREEPRAYLGLGRILVSTVRDEEGTDILQEVLRTGSDELAREALYLLSFVKMRAGEYAQSRHFLDEALRTPGPLPVWKLLARLGEVALASGEFAEAIVHLQSASLADDVDQSVVDPLLQDALQSLTFDFVLPEDLSQPSAVLDLLLQLKNYIAADNRLSDLMPSVQRLIVAMDAPLSVAIVGEFNSGKSTLLNALIGEPVLPMGVLPTTALAGILQYGPRRAARIVWKDDRVEEVSFQDATARIKEDCEDIEHLEFIYPHPDLRLVHYWDTPGFNALAQRHDDIAAAALETAEAILWVLDAGQVLSQTEFERIERLANGHERLLVVINKIDRLGPPSEERDAAIGELIEYVEDHLQDKMVGCYPVSALQALEGEDPFLDEFRRVFQEKIIQRAGRIKTLEIGRQLGFLVTTLQAFQNGLLARYGRLVEQVDQISEWLDEHKSQVPETIAREETQTLEDRVVFILETVERELRESLRPVSWLGGAAIAEEDRQFLLDMISDRFDSILERSRVRVSGHIHEFESSLAEKLGPILRGLPAQDSRAMYRRLEGFYDEARVYRLLCDEQLYGRFRARAQGQIEIGGPAALERIAQGQLVQDRWRGELERLLPSIRPRFEASLLSWQHDFLGVAERFLHRIRRDIELLELEARHRFDIRLLEEWLEKHGHQPTAE